MKLKHLGSHEELLESLPANGQGFVLLYKSGSEVSHCALGHISEAATLIQPSDLLFAVDVNSVRDIHSKYGVDTAPSLLVFRKGVFSNVIKGCMDRAYYEALLKGESTASSVRKEDGKKQKRVVVYTTPSCSWCTKIKEHLQRHQIIYREVDVAANPAMAEEMKRKSGQMGVPQTEIDGQMIVGFDRARIDRLLEIGAN